MFAVDQVIDYDGYGRPTMAYVQYRANDTAFSAFHFTRGKALPDAVGADLPVALVTVNGANPLAGMVYQADGIGTTHKFNEVVFAKTQVWSGTGSAVQMGSYDRIDQYAFALGANIGDHLQIQGEEIRARESSGFLGAIGSGGFSTADGASIRLHGLSLRFSMKAAENRFEAFATYRQGTAQSRFADSILTRIDARLNQSAVGIGWRNNVNAVAFAVSQPLHVTGGDLGMKLAIGRTDNGAVIYNTPTIVLNPGIRQINWELGMTHRLNQNAKIGMNLIYVKNPANSPGLSHDAGLLFIYGARI
ncbi:hypothetical protein A9404_06925 [Halothiobacillus diazotrophicus]|uniref:Porin domain-containing protein n=1 Tax=Halothiobacillus diazotrophicus TaxID=1860122 RepID=A0A191ZH24_9GAMM|nr:hypothetical protein [Halothiobacillus diazotrophicus]ANJ67153.1 hypothetical protein A9404_06925 [Halothiobacillus diazotrophicus]